MKAKQGDNINQTKIKQIKHYSLECKTSHNKVTKH